jgi:hypothetical protein
MSVVIAHWRMGGVVSKGAKQRCLRNDPFDVSQKLFPVIKRRFSGGSKHLSLRAVALNAVPYAMRQRMIVRIEKCLEDFEQLRLKGVPAHYDLADLPCVPFTFGLNTLWNSAGQMRPDMRR